MFRFPLPAPARAGMTLIEILAVVVILSLLVAAVSVGIFAYVGEAKSHIAVQQIGKIQNALHAFYLKHNAYPSSGEGLEVLTAAAKNQPWHLSPHEITDPWGRTFIYLTPGADGAPYEVKTLGADGIDGGEGENRDLSSDTLGSETGTGF